MDKRNELITSASQVFDSDGFRGIGIDKVIAPSGASTRTVYKYFGSRDGLVLAVLEARHRAFMNQLSDEQAPNGDPVESLFDTLCCWIGDYGARGCMLLRARSEYGQANQDIVALVGRQKRDFRDEIARRVECSLGHSDPALASQVWILFEGATATASVADASVICDAKAAALILLASARAGRS